MEVITVLTGGAGFEDAAEYLPYVSGAPAGPHRQEAQRLRQAAVADCRGC